MNLFQFVKECRNALATAIRDQEGIDFPEISVFIHPDHGIRGFAGGDKALNATLGTAHPLVGRAGGLKLCDVCGAEMLQIRTIKPGGLLVSAMERGADEEIEEWKESVQMAAASVAARADWTYEVQWNRHGVVSFFASGEPTIKIWVD